MITIDVVWHHEKRNPDKAAIVWDGRTYTYAELASRVRRLANALMGLGIGKGDRVGLLATNCVEHVETVFALSAIGAIWVPVNFRLTAPEVEFLINNAECAAVVYTADMMETVEALKGSVDGVRHWVGVGKAAKIGDDYDDLLAAASDAMPARAAEPNDLFAIQHTSGTTGRPKGAMLTHRQMLRGFAYSILEYGVRSDDVALQTLALFHSGGNMYLMEQFMVGSTVIIHNQFEPELVLRTVEREKVSFLGLVPSTIIFLLESPAIDKVDLSSVKRVQYGSSPIPVDRLARGLEVFDADFQGIYGQTEAAVFATHLKGEDHRRAVSGEVPHLLESCGHDVIGFESRIVDGDDNDVKTGEMGEVLLRGESVMNGYWNQPEATEKTLRGGWLHTGDMGRKDENSYMYIVDRKVDMVISGGENVYPVEVENVISNHPDVLEVAVIGVPDDKWVEAVKAIVAPRPGAALAPEDVIGHCRGNLGGFKIPKSVEIVEALPRTTTGKIKKNELREPYWANLSRRV